MPAVVEPGGEPGKPAERTVGYRPNVKAGLKAKLEALI
jgi:hypothetical protein